MNRNLAFLFWTMAVLFPLRAANDDWQRVNSIAAGTKVRVETAAEKIEGAFVAGSADAITLRRGNADESIARAGVRRVKVQQGSHRRRNTIIGTVVGLAIGAVTYGTLGTLLKNEGGEDVEMLLLAPVGAGALLGAVLPATRMVTVYEVPRK